MRQTTILWDLVLAEFIFNGYKQFELVPNAHLFRNCCPNNLKILLLPVMFPTDCS